MDSSVSTGSDHQIEGPTCFDGKKASRIEVCACSSDLGIEAVRGECMHNLVLNVLGGATTSSRIEDKGYTSHKVSFA